MLVGHDVSLAFEMGWSGLSNGDLISAAEGVQFELLVTTDKNLQYQQNLTGRRLAILVLPTTSWPRIQQHEAEVIEAVRRMQPGGFHEMRIWRD